MLEYMWMVEHEIRETEARDARFALERQASNERLGTRGVRVVESVSLRGSKFIQCPTGPQVHSRTAKVMKMSQANPKGHDGRRQTGPVPFRMRQMQRANNC